jgi:hypothetical protein
MRKFFTVFDLIWVVAPIVLTGIGIAVGRQFGLVGGIVGAVLGFLAGCYVGQLPTLRQVRSFGRRAAGMTAAELRAYLHAPVLDLNYPPNFVLLELNRRREVILSDLWAIFDMLESTEVERRRCAVAAITSAFPEIADEAPDYDINDDTDTCIVKVRALRESAEQSFGTDGNALCSNQGDSPARP